jgi:hypothetical protein
MIFDVEDRLYILDMAECYGFGINQSRILAYLVVVGLAVGTMIAT